MLCSILYRAGRSGHNVRVSKDIVPQSRVRVSAVENKHVLVVGGEHRGLVGTIDSAIPGGYYLVSNLFDDRLGLDTVIRSEHLELISDNELEKR